MPRPPTIDENTENALPKPIKMHKNLDRPLLKPEAHVFHEDKQNCCENGLFCWYLFCLCGLCDRSGKYDN